MTITLGGFALLALVALFVFSGGSRLRILLAALLGAAVGGLLATIAVALLKGFGNLGTALLGAFT